MCKSRYASLQKRRIRQDAGRVALGLPARAALACVGRREGEEERAGVSRVVDSRESRQKTTPPHLPPVAYATSTVGPGRSGARWHGGTVAPCAAAPGAHGLFICLPSADGHAWAAGQQLSYSEVTAVQTEVGDTRCVSPEGCPWQPLQTVMCCLLQAA
eukprot:365592-Chlamydomonas_euryale.AAC.11